MVRVLVNESESLQSMTIKTKFHQVPPTPLWMQNQTFKNEGVFRCSETMLLQVSSVGIYFYMFTKNQKTRLKRTRKICLCLNGRKQPNTTLLLRVANLLVDFMPLNSIKILELPPLRFPVNKCFPASLAHAQTLPLAFRTNNSYKYHGHERYVLSFSENVLIDWASLMSFGS